MSGKEAKRVFRASEWILVAGASATVLGSVLSVSYDWRNSLLHSSLEDVALVTIPLALLTVTAFSFSRSREARRAEKALRVSEKKYRDLADSLPEIIFEMDLRGNLTWVNKAAFVDFKYEEGDFAPGKFNALDMLVPGDREGALQSIARIRNGEDVGLTEYTCTRKDGATFPALFSTNLVKDKEGNPVGFRGVIIDITERKNQEIALAQSEKMQRIITETAGDAIIMIDSRGLCTFWNPAAEKIFGYSEKEILGRDLHQLIAPEEYRPAYTRGFGEFRIAGKGAAIDRTVELDGMRKDGKRFPIEITLRAINRDNRWHGVGIIRDITSRRSAEKLMREEADRTNRWFEELKEGAFVSTVEGILLNANDSAAGLLGVDDKNDLIGTDVRKLHVNPEQRARIIAEIRERGFVRNRLVDLRRKDGKEIQLATTAYLKAGKLFGHLVVPESLRAEDLIPICSVMECTKIRDASGQWHRFEEYFARTFDYRFSHSICPDCAQALYPDEDLLEEQPVGSVRKQ